VKSGSLFLSRTSNCNGGGGVGLGTLEQLVSMKL
jgi:hypothetical protein